MAAIDGDAPAATAANPYRGTDSAQSLRQADCRGAGLNDQTSPTIITSASGISVSPSQQLTITYLSGTEVAGPGFSPVDAQGNTNFAANDGTGNGFGVFPSFYMPSAEYPIYLSELVGTFADSSGDIVGTPFPIGLSATVTVPSGASQLQLGVNDDEYSDNSGFFDVQVSGTAVPEPASLSVLALGVLSLMARRRRTGLGASIVRV